MGCDMHAYAEQKYRGEWKYVERVFEGHRSYGLFSFLTGGEVRNYSGISSPFIPRGIPLDLSNEVAKEYEAWDADAYTASFLLLSELTDFDYEAKMEDRRYTKQISHNAWDGGATCDPGQGRTLSWKEFLGEYYFSYLARLQDVENVGGDVRLIFWFDN